MGKRVLTMEVIWVRGRSEMTEMMTLYDVLAARRKVIRAPGLSRFALGTTSRRRALCSSMVIEGFRVRIRLAEYPDQKPGQSAKPELICLFFSGLWGINHIWSEYDHRDTFGPRVSGVSYL